HVVFTFNGSAVGDPVKCYFDGVEKTTRAFSSFDGTTTMSDGPCQITIGVESFRTPGYHFDGRIYEVAVWNTVLGSSAVATVYNAGTGAFNLGANSGNYTSSVNLIHWWRLGFDSENIGRDYGSSPADLDLPVDMDSSDIVPDIPGEIRDSGDIAI